MDIQVYCAHSRMVDIETMVENPRNPNKHSDKQISLLAKIIKLVVRIRGMVGMV